MTLLRPEWLLALPLLAGFAWWLSRRVGGIGDWERVSDPGLLQAMTQMGRVQRQGQGSGWKAALLAACLAILALTGPAVQRRDTVSFRNLDAAIFVLDASDSATESPAWPQLVALARHGMAALGTRPGALVVYAGDAYVATDVTGDLKQLGQTLSLVDGETVPDKGSRPERGLNMALQLLAEGDVIYGDVILFSDGGGYGPQVVAAAQRIAARGARLSVVPIGDPVAGALAVGGGDVFALEDTLRFASFLNGQGRAQLMAQDYPLLYWRDLGRWLLALALLPLLTLFRRAAA